MNPGTALKQQHYLLLWLLQIVTFNHEIAYSMNSIHMYMKHLQLESPFLQLEDVALVVDVVHLVHPHPHDVLLEHGQLRRQVQAREARLHPDKI